ncbi:hypothetical protein F4861DRAFT_540726 [Xylaria intraflava]|nr:hypothetical protein F4861DRAFT_540726 [Xylaria intraflava]
MEKLVAQLRQNLDVVWQPNKATRTRFLSDDPMDGRPSCSQEDFEQPRLRKCVFDLAAIDLKRSSRMGGGLDGYLWKVWFGEQAFVLKVFWDAVPPQFPHYFAAQREGQNAALLQMMEAAVEDAASGSEFPILVNPRPETKSEAMGNTRAFSDQGRRGQLPSQGSGAATMAISSIPRIKKCYGWTRIHGSTISVAWPKKLHPGTLRVDRKVTREFSASEEYIAILYEYVDERDNEHAAVERAADFYWHAGFGYTMSSAARNWKDGVLVDLSDIVHVSGYGWNQGGYGPRSAAMILLD